MKYKIKVFLAVSAIIFAVQVTAGLNDYSSDPGIVFITRVLIAALVAAGFTFFWGEFRKRQT